jgi:thiosulfate reductase cytochrome b subunit
MTMGRRVLVYKRFERFWHWTQALLIILLGVTGFEIHGSYRWLGFERAVAAHDALAGALVVLVAFAIFWHLTTGEWRHYQPTLHRLSDMVRFYLVGIFRGEPHPFRKTELSKLNPLQRITYLGLKLLVIPLQVISGGLYYYHDVLVAEWGLPHGVGTIAVLHTLGAFALAIFLVVHVYLTTTGHTVSSNIRAMITGWEER